MCVEILRRIMCWMCLIVNLIMRKLLIAVSLMVGLSVMGQPYQINLIKVGTPALGLGDSNYLAWLKANTNFLYFSNAVSQLTTNLNYVSNNITGSGIRTSSGVGTNTTIVGYLSISNSTTGFPVTIVNANNDLDSSSILMGTGSTTGSAGIELTNNTGEAVDFIMNGSAFGSGFAHTLAWTFFNRGNSATGPTPNFAMEWDGNFGYLGVAPFFQSYRLITMNVTNGQFVHYDFNGNERLHFDPLAGITQLESSGRVTNAVGTLGATNGHVNAPAGTFTGPPTPLKIGSELFVGSSGGFVYGITNGSNAVAWEAGNSFGTWSGVAANSSFDVYQPAYVANAVAGTPVISGFGPDGVPFTIVNSAADTIYQRLFLGSSVRSWRHIANSGNAYTTFANDKTIAFLFNVFDNANTSDSFDIRLGSNTMAQACAVSGDLAMSNRLTIGGLSPLFIQLQGSQWNFQDVVAISNPLQIRTNTGDSAIVLDRSGISLGGSVGNVLMPVGIASKLLGTNSISIVTNGVVYPIPITQSGQTNIAGVATSLIVQFLQAMPSTNYIPRVSSSAAQTVEFYSAKTTTSFTYNCAAANAANIYWSVTQMTQNP